VIFNTTVVAMVRREAESSNAFWGNGNYREARQSHDIDFVESSDFSDGYEEEYDTAKNRVVIENAEAFFAFRRNWKTWSNNMYIRRPDGLLRPVEWMEQFHETWCRAPNRDVAMICDLARYSYENHGGASMWFSCYRYRKTGKIAIVNGECPLVEGQYVDRRKEPLGVEAILCAECFDSYEQCANLEGMNADGYVQVYCALSEDLYGENAYFGFWRSLKDAKQGVFTMLCNGYDVQRVEMIRLVRRQRRDKKRSSQVHR
jgi:hypothetical protein